MTAAAAVPHATVASAPSDASVLARVPPWVVVACEMVVAALLMAWTLGRQSFWLDETLAAHFVTGSIGTVLRHLTIDEPMTGLYYGVLRVWAWPFGRSEVALRSLSVLLAVASVPLVYSVAARLYTVAVGLVAGLLLAVSTTFVAIGQQARQYALVLFLVSLATWCFVRAVERGGRAEWLVYAVVAALAVYAQVIVLAVLAAHAVSLLFRRRSEVPWRFVSLAAGTFAVLLVPLFALLLKRGTTGTDWITRTSSREIQQTYEALAGGNQTLLLAALVACAVATVAAIRSWRRAGSGTESWSYGLLLASVTVPTLVLIAVSFVKHLYVPRYLIGMLPAFVILVAVGIVAMRPRWLGIAFMVGLLALNIRVMNTWLGTDTVSVHTTVTREDWRGAVDYVRARARPTDTVVLQPGYTSIPWNYYASRAAARPVPDLAAFDGAYRDYVGADQVRTLADSHDRVWVVLSQAAPAVREGVRTELATAYDLASARRFLGEIEVLRYDARE